MIQEAFEKEIIIVFENVLEQSNGLWPPKMFRIFWDHVKKLLFSVCSILVEKKFWQSCEHLNVDKNSHHVVQALCNEIYNDLFKKMGANLGKLTTINRICAGL